MPQGRKMKMKARLPPKVKARVVPEHKLHATRKMAPAKTKPTKLSHVEYRKAEKAIRANIEDEMRSRAVSSGGSSKGNVNSKPSASKTTMKSVLKNLKK